MTETLRIRYGFDLPDGSKKQVELCFDSKNFRLTNEVPAEPPFLDRTEIQSMRELSLERGRTHALPVGAAHGAGG